MEEQQLTSEQQQILEDRDWMISIKPAKERRAVLAHIITCCECEEDITLRLKNNSPLSLKELNSLLILQGWQVAQKGYVCKNYYEGGIKSMVRVARERSGSLKIVDAEKKDEEA